ncbi:MAG TPA: hypothetical protein VN655_17925 [Pseudolabrys sp.]|jgi:hypothetical protein|nr:hypothetical protein [Pseudolabrys sp.]
MAINNILEIGDFFGTINTDAVFTKTINFGSSNILATPWVQDFGVNDDDGAVDLSVLHFKDASGTHTGPFKPGVFANKCTSVTFKMETVDCLVDTIFRVFFF